MFHFNKVKLISHSSFVDKDKDLNLLEQIAYIARVSNPSNQHSVLTSEKLCKYLLDNAHFSPFEMVNVVLEIETTRDISRQILRHRSFSFQEFSNRYADPTESLGFVKRECRLQHSKNRQMSVETSNSKLLDKFNKLQDEIISIQKEMYDFCIEQGIAKEQSRVLLSEGLIKTRLYMSGSLRSWIHYIQVRTDKNTTQREHFDVACKCAEVISTVFPFILQFVSKNL